MSNLHSNFFVNVNRWALPLEMDINLKEASYKAVAVRVLCFMWQIVSINIPKVTELMEGLEAKSPTEYRRTKAYADERQKARRNRRRKPNKKMANLYSLN